MTRGLILAADGVSDTHLEYAFHRLREDAVLVDLASPTGGKISGSRGGSWDTSSVDDLSAGILYDLIVVPGGKAPEQLAAHDRTLGWLSDHLETGAIVCAVAEGVKLLTAIGVIDGRLVTGPESVLTELEAINAEPTGEAVTVDGPFVTIQSTDALPFGIAAALANVVIPQGRADQAAERPHWTTSDNSGR